MSHLLTLVYEVLAYFGKEANQKICRRLGGDSTMEYPIQQNVVCATLIA